MCTLAELYREMLTILCIVLSASPYTALLELMLCVCVGGVWLAIFANVIMSTQNLVDLPTPPLG